MLNFFFSSRRRHTRCSRDWSSDVCSSDLSAPDTVCALHSRDAGLRSNRFIAELNVLANSLDCCVQIVSAGMAIDKHAIARSSPQQMVERNVETLGANVPQCGS